jgi:hypothetical protein
MICPILWSSIEAAATPVVVKYGVDPTGAQDYGKLLQKDLPGCGAEDGVGDLAGSGCGPSAAVNSFVYLQNKYSSIYGKKLVPELDRNMPINDRDGDGDVDA